MLGDGAATLALPEPLPPDMDARVRERIVPALEAILTSAIERDALLEEVVETSALRRSDDLKTSILRAVSHDLRSPLTAMITSGEALGSPALDDEDRAALSGAIVAEGARLERLIGKLLDLSRLEAGEAEPRVDLVDLAEVLTAARDDLADPETAARLVTLQLDRDLPPLRADAVQLERAFANLMENALSHGGGQPVSRPGASGGAPRRRAGGRSRPRDPGRRAGADLLAVLPRPGRVADRDRRRPGPRDRPRVRGGQRRHGARRVAAGPGRVVRG